MERDHLEIQWRGWIIFFLAGYEHRHMDPEPEQESESQGQRVRCPAGTLRISKLALSAASRE